MTVMRTHDAGTRRPPLNIAHRGGAALWPENTLHAFGRALDMGCDGLEIDVQLSRDGAAVVHHDPYLRPDFTRDAGGAWLEGEGPESPGPSLADLSFADLRAVRIGTPRPGSAYERKHPLLTPHDAHIPSLDETLDLFTAHPGAPSCCMVELKHPIHAADARVDPDHLVARTVEALERAAVGDRAVMVGFNWDVLLRLRRLKPDARLWFTTYPAGWYGDDPSPPLPPSTQELERFRAAYQAGAPWLGGFHPGHYGSTPRAVKAAGAEGWFPYGPDADDDMIHEALALGLSVGVWGVNDAAGMARFIDLNVQAICTDRPDILAEQIGARAQG